MPKQYIVLLSALAVLALVFVAFQILNMEKQQIPQNTPTQPVAEKIDINAVCDGALAYMTFPDGAAADAFLVECKEGRRPEVIEQFKQQMGLGDGAAI
jgi:hypothetical protein